MPWNDDQDVDTVCVSVMDISPGVLVTPTVRLSRPLGEGGMGSVWVADHLGLDTEVAVKFIHADALRRDPSLAERFKREASIAAKLRSPHVVQVFDHGSMEDGTPFIVMELLEGMDLGARLKERPLDEGEAVLLISQVAEVLDRAHGLGVVHRDVKPDNLFLIESGYKLFVKVLDFGVAKDTRPPAQGMTTTGAMVGTPVYMSPELIESAKDADHYADLWALGVVGYQSLVVRTPFEGETLGALCIAISKGEFHFPSKFRPELGPEVDQFFARALDRDPELRFETAHELAAAFAGALGVDARPSWPIQRLPNDGVSKTVAAAAPTDSSKETQVSAPPQPTKLSSQPNEPTLSPASSTMPPPLQPRNRWWLAALAMVVAGCVAFIVRGGSKSPVEPNGATVSAGDGFERAAASSSGHATATMPSVTASSAAAPTTPAAVPGPSVERSTATPKSATSLRPATAPPTPEPTASAATPSNCFYYEDGKLRFRSDRPECQRPKANP